MSGYTKLIIFIVVLLSISAAIIFIDSSVTNINRSMPEISDAIVQGDEDYNLSVELVNNKSYDESMLKANSAEDNYKSALDKLMSIKNNFYSDLNSVHKEYIDITIEELESKINAVDELKQSIDYFQRYYNYTGTTHASKANDIIYDALNYQNQRNEIVNDNPELFNQ